MEEISSDGREIELRPLPAHHPLPDEKVYKYSYIFAIGIGRKPNQSGICGICGICMGNMQNTLAPRHFGARQEPPWRFAP